MGDRKFGGCLWVGWEFDVVSRLLGQSWRGVRWCGKHAVKDSDRQDAWWGIKRSGRLLYDVCYMMLKWPYIKSYMMSVIWCLLYDNGVICYKKVRTSVIWCYRHAWCLLYDVITDRQGTYMMRYTKVWTSVIWWLLYDVKMNLYKKLHDACYMMSVIW